MSTFSQMNSEQIDDDDQTDRVLASVLAGAQAEEVTGETETLPPEMQAIGAADAPPPATGLLDGGLDDFRPDLLSIGDESLPSQESVLTELASLDGGAAEFLSALDGDDDALENGAWVSFGTGALNGATPGYTSSMSFSLDLSEPFSVDFGGLDQWRAPGATYQWEAPTPSYGAGMDQGFAIAGSLGNAPASSDGVGAPAAATSLNTIARYLSEYNAGGAGDDFWDEFWGSLTPEGWAPNFHWNLTNSGLYAQNGTLTYNVMGNWYDSDGITDDGADSTTKINAIRHALNVYEDMLGINFVEVTTVGTSTGGGVDIAFGNETSGKAFANFNADGKTTDGNASGNIQNAWINIAKNWSGNGTIGDYYFTTALHEIGHALGLGHSGNYNAGSGSPTYDDAYWENDTRQFTMMSYWAQSNYTAPGQQTPSNVNSIGPQAVDWLALNRMYDPMGFGINDGITTSNTTWGFNSTWYDWTPGSSGPALGYANTAFASLEDLLDTNTVTIVDGGGIDTLDLSGFSNNTKIDVSEVLGTDTRPSISNVGGLNGNLMIGVGTIIENVIGGAGSELIYGNNAANTINGNGGNDTIYGYGGNDTLYGDAGDDRLYGGADNDWLYGGIGNDTLYGSSGDDRLYGGTGADYLSGSTGNDYIYAGSSSSGGEVTNDTLYGGSANDFLYGSDGANRMYGGNNDDFLRGNGGNDSLYGGGGIDRASYYSATGAVFVNLATGTATGADGTDLLDSIENVDGSNGFGDTLTGDGNANVLRGYGGDDLLDGGGGDDLLYGSSGNDTLDAGSGTDTLYGGSGDDRLNRGGGSSLQDAYYGGSGIDTIGTDGSGFVNGVIFNLAAGYMTLNGANYEIWNGFENYDGSSGTGGEDVIGTSGANRIETGSGNNNLQGGDGNDTLLGGGGNDSLYGGLDNDWLYGGIGNDTLYGSSGDDRLYGGTGADYLSGSTGNDYIYAGSSSSGGEVTNDTLYGGSANDFLYGSDGANRMYGGNNDDFLRGNGGNDSLYGGGGIDRASYYSATGAVFVNLATGTATGADGTDLLDSIENVDGSNGFGDTLTGDGNANVLRGYGGDDLLDGGGGDDLLYGSSGNDTLDAGSGTDTLYGGSGDDRLNRGGGSSLQDAYYGGSGIDTIGTDGSGFVNGVIFNLAAGYMTLNGANYEIWNGFENYDGSSGTGGEDVIGTSGANRIETGSGNNNLQGGDGNDTLLGGGGNDTLDGGLGNDELYGGANDDVIMGGAGVDTLFGGAGNDTLNAGDGVFGNYDQVNGGDGNDLMIYDSGDFFDDFDGGNGIDTVSLDWSGNFIIDLQAGTYTTTFDTPTTWDILNVENVLSIGGGNDSITGTLGDNEILGGDGNDTVNALKGDDSVDGGLGDDVLAGYNGNDTLLGGNGDDTILGGRDDDSIIGHAGNDSLSGNDGNDFLDGRDGLDTINAGSGNDTVEGGSGDDMIVGGGGQDRLIGAGDNDTLFGNSGDDYLNAGNGNDVVWGGQGDDTVFGGNGNDYLAGLNGNDVISGSGGTDTVFGGRGDDTLFGGDGDDSIGGGQDNDNLLGGAGNDTLNGGTQNDTLNGQDGNDVLIGSGGADSFRFDFGSDTDTVQTYAVGTDELMLDTDLWGGITLTETQVVNTFAAVSGTDVIFNFGGGDILIIEGLNSTAGLAGDIVFV